MTMTTQQITAELAQITDRIAASFDESADKWTADKHLTLEDIEQRLLTLMERIEANTPTTADAVTYTHPDVFTIGVRDGWADPETDPTRIDWAPRQAAAAIPFEVIDGRPVNPCGPTGVRHGRNELGHWGEALAADALVSALDYEGRRWIVMVERDDGHGWALPGGHVDPGESALEAAIRELAEETGLTVPGASWQSGRPRYVPDPRASDEAWMVTVLCTAHLGTLVRFPDVTGADDAARAAWIRADSYDTLTARLTETYGGAVFAAHVGMLRTALGVA
ncbi:NUDIX domain-containing protein [Spirillospora sp. NPDC048911]|uniref:NUDIX domain-containing protein n=1 Tax=Spirillospora sp. NPDC048911 TaxID=3364527 RepID=UPI0037233C83